MKQIVRLKTFETNSSSCHSMTLLAKANDIDTIPDISKESLRLSLGEYGWGDDILDTTEEKLSYLLTYCVCYADRSDREYFCKKMKDYFPNLKVIHFKEDEYIPPEFYEKVCNDVFSSSSGYSFIDHESAHVPKKIINNIAFKDYLHRDCVVYITSDNANNSPRVSVEKAKSLGVSEEIANEIAESNSCVYYKQRPYEISNDLYKEIERLGGICVE